MNRLLTAPPSEIEIDGKTYHIDTDYYSALMTLSAYKAYESGELSERGYLSALISNMYVEENDALIFNSEAVKFASEYLCAFQDKTDGKGSNIPPIDIEQDSAMIFNAFLAKGINLRTAKLTYEEFWAIFREFPEDCEFCRIMYLRDRWYNHHSKMTKEELAACNRIGLSKIRVRNPKADKDNREFKEKGNAKRAAGLEKIAACYACNTNIIDGVCQNEICLVRGKPAGNAKCGLNLGAVNAKE